MEDRIVTDQLLEEEQNTEGTLRPQTLEDYTGQARMKESLWVCIQAAQRPRRTPGPRHLLRPARPGQDHHRARHRQGNGRWHPARPPGSS